MHYITDNSHGSLRTKGEFSDLRCRDCDARISQIAIVGTL